MFLGFDLREDREFGDVVVDDESGEEDDADEGNLVDAFLELLVDVSAQDAFDDEKENHAAVQNGDRHEIEDAQVDADVGHQADDGCPAWHVHRLVDLLTDADGAAQATNGDLACEHALNHFDDEQ